MHSKQKAALVCCAMILALMFSDLIRQSVHNSLILSVQVLIPSLYPSFVLSGMLLDFGLHTLLPPPIASFIISLICGYPLGTRTVCNYYIEGNLNFDQANTLLMCTANASPAFIVVAVGNTIMGNQHFGYQLLISQILSSVLIFFFNVPDKLKFSTKKISSVSLGTSLIENIRSSAQQLLFVCSCTMFFGILFDALCQTKLINYSIFLVLISSIELTHGIGSIDNTSIYTVAFILGFSGIAILIQCIYFMQKTDLSIRHLIIGKLLYAFNMPCIISLFYSPTFHKIITISIIILTNSAVTCIMRCKGCEKDYDFFKRYRKMLRILRARNKNNHEGASSLPT